jgi:hypothetical protein
MSRTRIIYPCEAVFVSPAPASGYTTISSVGVLGNAQDINLVKSINRVQSFSYTVDAPRTDISQIGKQSTVERPVLGSPEVNIQFDYIIHGIVNDSRLGFNANYLITGGLLVGESYYSDTFAQSAIEGFVTRDMTPEENELRFPYLYKDQKNIFVALGREGQDVNQSAYFPVDPEWKNLGVVGFGNCYLTNYVARASVGAFPTVSVSYLGENMDFHTSGSGVPIPSLNAQTRSGIEGVYYSLPTNFIGNNVVTIPSTLLPGDITVDITALPARTSITALDGLGIDGGVFAAVSGLSTSFSDIKLQNYEINLGLNRQPLYSMGHKLPVDRPIQFPVFVNLGFEAIVGDGKSGSIADVVNRNDDYNIVIKIRQRAGYIPAGTAVAYHFRRAKFGAISFNDTVGSIAKTANFSFQAEIDREDLTKGFFMSGLLNTDYSVYNAQLAGSLLLEDGFSVLQEDNTSEFILFDTQQYV